MGIKWLTIRWYFWFFVAKMTIEGKSEFICERRYQNHE